MSNWRTWLDPKETIWVWVVVGALAFIVGGRLWYGIIVGEWHEHETPVCEKSESP